MILFPPWNATENCTTKINSATMTKGSFSMIKERFFFFVFLRPPFFSKRRRNEKPNPISIYVRDDGVLGIRKVFVSSLAHKAATATMYPT